MLGAIAGDIIGSVYEGKMAWQSARTPHFKPLFHPLARLTDDTVLTVAVADSILRGGDLVDLFKDYARRYPSVGYGGDFRRWAASPSRHPYNSWGNGAAMRASPVGYAYDSLDEVLLLAYPKAPQVCNNAAKSPLCFRDHSEVIHEPTVPQHLRRCIIRRGIGPFIRRRIRPGCV